MALLFRKFTFFILFLLFFGVVYAQPFGGVVAGVQGYKGFFMSTMYISPQKQHAYFSIGVDENIIDQNYNVLVSIPSLGVGPLLLDQSYQTIIPNLPAAASLFNIKVDVFSQSNQFIASSTLTYDRTLKDSQGIIDVSEELYSVLQSFGEGTTNPDGTTIFSTLCNTETNPVEIIAFLQDYLNVTADKAKTIFDAWSNLYDVSFDEMIASPETAQQLLLCQLLLFWRDNYDSPDFGGGVFNGQPPCLCRLIRTNSSALHTGTNQLSASDECRDYEARTVAVNEESLPPSGHRGSNDDDLIFSWGTLGAAKGGRLYGQYDGQDSSPENYQNATVAASSILRFRSVCINPYTLSPDIEDCVSCEKEIEIDYGYWSAYRIAAETGTCIFCTQESDIRLNDWAVFAVQNDQEFEIVEDTIVSFRAVCEDDDQTNLDSFLVDIPGVVNSVASVFTGPFDLQETIDAALAVSEFVQTNIIESTCDQLENQNTRLLGGRRTYTLMPGTEFTAAMTSGAALGLEIINHGEALAEFSSSMRMAAVLTTKADGSGEVPEYCECEKIASYVVGTMEEFMPETDFPVYRTDRGVDWSTALTSPLVPFLLPDLERQIGSFIGLRGPWPEEAFTPACGGCSDVIIPCHSDCVFVRGCDGEGVVSIQKNDDLPLQGLNHGETLKDDLTKENNNINIENGVFESAYEIQPSISCYPNPIKGDGSFNIKAHLPRGLYVLNLKIYDISGRVVESIEFDDNEGMLTIKNVKVPSGINGNDILIVVFSMSDGTMITHKMIR